MAYKKIKNMLKTSKGNHMGRKDENMKKVEKEALKLNKMDKKDRSKHEKRYED